jgi:hypothetical protein
MMQTRLGETGIRIAARISAIALAFFLQCSPAFPATYLIAVSETIDSLPGQVLPPVTEGIFDALFEGGHIVFNTKDGSEIPSRPELLAIADSGGAEYMLEVRVAYTRTARAEGPATVEATARYSLYSVPAGEVLASAVISDTNMGSEKETDLYALGFRLGGRVADEAMGLIGARSERNEKKALSLRFVPMI